MIEYPKCLEFITDVIYPDKRDFERSIEIARKLVQSGKPVGGIDIIIASMCINRNARLITKDKHFGYIKSVEPAFEAEIRK